jgi:hypothetical protein
MTRTNLAAAAPLQVKRHWITVLMFSFASHVSAVPPTRDAIFSCLLARSTIRSLEYSNLSTDEVSTEDDYMAGYDARFFITIDGKDIGYAVRRACHGIIYDGIIYPASAARFLLSTTEPPGEFDPYSAEWGMVSDKNGTFLCVSFPYGELGKSGDFQIIRAAYMLAIGDKKIHHSFYYVVANTDTYKTR